MLHGFDYLRQQYSQLAKPPGASQSVTSTVQTLADRLSKQDESVTIEDRKAAVLSLKGLSRDHNRLVGRIALAPLLTSLQRDSSDEEVARALVECCITLCEVQTAESQTPTNPKKKVEPGPPLGLQHADIFLSEPGPLHALLPLLAPKRAFYTRFASLQLLGALLRLRPSRVQDHVLVAPGGCGAVLECLSEGAGSSAEIVRNEALLLLPHLVHANADIQKLVAFEGAFEKLLDICAVEGRVEGGVIVQDALEGLESLLRYNVSNQNYFRETLSIPMLAPLLFYPPPPPPPSSLGPNNARQAEQEYARQLEAFAFQEWDHQKVTNARLVIGIAGLLVGGQGEGRKANQQALAQSGMTRCLFELALASTAPDTLKSQSLNVLSSLLKASSANQELLSTLLVCPIQALPAPQANLQAGGDPERQDHGLAASNRPSSEFQRHHHHHHPHQLQPTLTRLPARPAILSLIGTAVNGTENKESLGVRVAALACFESFVADNLEARLAILGTMTPPASQGDERATPDPNASDGRPVSAGSLLLEGLIRSPGTESAGVSARFDAYKYLLSSFLFSHLIRGSETAKRAAREIAITAKGETIKRVIKDDSGEEEEDDDEDGVASIIQVIVGNLTQAERELSEAVRRERGGVVATATNPGGSSQGRATANDWTRVMTGYLVCLSTWLWDSPLSVRDLLSESSNLQVLIQPVAQSSGVDPMIQALCAFLLGIAYEFDSEPGQVAITRKTMHPILHSRIGSDQFATRLTRLRDDARFSEVGPDVFERICNQEVDLEILRARLEANENHSGQDQDALVEEKVGGGAGGGNKEVASSTSPPSDSAGLGPGLESEETESDEESRRRRRIGFWFDWSFVEFWKNNFVMVQKSILVDPASSSANHAAASTELLDAQRQMEGFKETIAKQIKEIEALEKRLEAMTQEKVEETTRLGNKLEEEERKGKEVLTRLGELEAEMERVKAEKEKASVEDSERRRRLEVKVEEAEAARRSWEEKAWGLEARLSEREKEMEGLRKEREEKAGPSEREEELGRKVKELEGARKEREEELGRKVKELEGARKENEEQVEQRVKELEEVRKENEDLLVLLEEISSKRKKEKALLRNGGFEVSEDEEEEEEEEE
ncbi:hypothetical protein IE53DRAFT_411778 [Violaceomyces palustris]|uniref:Uncharacterized protein n=1 Tax=Violaceomyces palustris TaxID=1673888 RepID=A0ACD0NTQ4_9BASI|nr:hypothetical protein IE53DRAFT_411778 [Violaceomyces palustris]